MVLRLLFPLCFYQDPRMDPNLRKDQRAIGLTGHGVHKEGFVYFAYLALKSYYGLFGVLEPHRRSNRHGRYMLPLLFRVSDMLLWFHVML